VLAVDRSEGAVVVARQNLERTGLGERVEFVRGELLRGLSGPFDLVVSNPPYVPPEEYETLQPEIRLYEPYEAVVGVGVGETIARDARAVLQPGGWLVLECGDGQAESLAAELGALGYADVLVSPDLAGRDRIVEGRCP
jgi:release factor glutamine methyltransferase